MFVFAIASVTAGNPLSCIQKSDNQNFKTHGFPSSCCKKKKHHLHGTSKVETQPKLEPLDMVSDHLVMVALITIPERCKKKTVIVGDNGKPRLLEF